MSKVFNFTPETAIYIAGHTGLIGSAFVAYFRKIGYTNLILKTHEELDLSDAIATQSFFQEENPEVVILAAGRVGGILANNNYPADFITENLAIQLNVIKYAARSEVARLLFFGSSCMYPRETSQPMEESRLCTGHPEPTSIAYASAKYSGFQMCQAYNRQLADTRFICVIPNSVYGPNDNFDSGSGHVLSSLINRFHSATENGDKHIELWGSGTPRREFVFSQDLAAISVKLLEMELDKDQLPINIGVGEDISIKKLAEKIRILTGFSGVIDWDSTKPDGAPRKLLDNSHLMKLLGHFDFTDLDRGLSSTYESYLEKVNSV